MLPLNQQCKPWIPFETNSEILHFKSSSKRLLQATNTAFKKWPSNPFFLSLPLVRSEISCGLTLIIEVASYACTSLSHWSVGTIVTGCFPIGIEMTCFWSYRITNKRFQFLLVSRWQQHSKLRLYDIQFKLLEFKYIASQQITTYLTCLNQ